MYTIVFTLSAVSSVLSSLLLVRYIKRTKCEVACPYCDYPEAPDKSPYDVNRRCSECGLTWSQAEKRNDWKRRVCWLVTILSFSISLWSGAAAYRSDTVLSLVPTWALSAVIDESDSIRPDAEFNWVEGMLLRELQQRRMNESQELQTRQLALLAQAIVDELGEKGILVRSRSKWPRNVPVRVAPAYPEFFSSLGDVIFRLSGDNGEVLAERQMGRLPGNVVYDDPTAVVPDHMISSGSVSLLVEILGGPDIESILAKRHVEINIEFVQSWKDILTPVDDDVRWLFDPATVVNDMRRYRELTTLVSGMRHGTRIPQFGIGCKIQIVEADNVLTEVEYVFSSQLRGQRGELEVIRLIYRTDDIWATRHVKVVPDPEIALRDFDNDVFWFGEPFQFPTRLPRR